MVDIAPFRALRYSMTSSKNDLSRFICPPYDVISPTEREALVKKSSDNVVQMELPSGGPADKYGNAAAILRSWKARGLLQEDRHPSFYLLETTYRLQDAFAPAQKLKRYGVLSALRLEPPGKGAVHPHEKTLPKAKEDRLNLLTSLQMNVSSIFGLFFDKKHQWESWVRKATKGKPLATGKEKKDLEHRLWKVDSEPLQRELRKILSKKDLYIADGHHRYEVSWAYREGRQEKETSVDNTNGWNRVMAYICPMEEKGLLMLPTHRLVRSARTLAEWKNHLQALFEIEEVSSLAALVKVLARRPNAQFPINRGSGGQARPSAAGRRLGWVHQNGAFLLRLKKNVSISRCLESRPKALQELDVILLHDLVLREDAAPEPEIVFTRDLKAMGEKVKGDAQWVGFVLSSPGVESLARVAAAQEVMPPKTTYFYPKVPTGFVMMPLEQIIK